MTTLSDPAPVALSSRTLHNVRWPVVLLAAALGLVPHLMLIESSHLVRLITILVIHALIVPIVTLVALAALERRARTLEAANAELTRHADDLAQRSRQQGALGAAVRLLAGAPSVATVLEPLTELAREITQAPWLQLDWQAPGVAPDCALALAPETDRPADTAAGHSIGLKEGGATLGRIAYAPGAEDEFTEASLRLLASEIGLRWRLRQTESKALSVISAAGAGQPGIEAPRRARELLRVLCDAAGADGAAFYLRRGEQWQRRAEHGVAAAPDTAGFQDATGIWAIDDGAVLCVKGAADGVLVLSRSDRAPIDTTPLNPALLQIVAGHGTALMRLSDRMQELIWAERRRISRELHDDVCQAIASVHMQLGHLETLIAKGSKSAAPRAGELREVALQAYEASRLAVEGFREAPEPGETGLDFFNRILRDACTRRHAALVFRSGDDVSLDAELAWQLGRVAQEVVTNAARHGGARQVEVTLGVEASDLLLTIRDDGTFRAEPDPSRQHHGLVIMGERLAELGGSLTIESEDGHTCLRATVPSSLL